MESAVLVFAKVMSVTCPQICLVHHHIPLREKMLLPAFPLAHFVLNGWEDVCGGQNVSLEGTWTQSIHYISYGHVKWQS